ncbi:MAG: methionine ABC transporter permease [Sporolactobacillus sp.]
MGISLAQFIQALQETLYMVGVSLFAGALVGLPVGIILVVTRPDGVLPNKLIYQIVNPIINIVRSLPFIILLVAVLPLTRFIVHTTIGTTASIVPLVLYVSPYIARLVENSLLDVDPGILEAAKAMGASPYQIIFHFLLPEAFGSLILTFTTAAIGLIDATTMAGTIGGGGLGNMAITYGYQEFNNAVILATVVVLVILVQIIQSLGNRLSRKIRRS